MSRKTCSQIIEELSNMDKIMVNEASLGRLYQHIKKSEPVAMISASHNELSDTEKNTRFKELQGYFKRAQFGYNKVIGGYIEHGGKEVTEKSFIVYAPKERMQELKDLVVSLGKKYKQESILFTYPDGKVVYVNTDSDSGSLGHETVIGTNGIDTHSVDKYFTLIGHKKFVFKSISEEYIPTYGSVSGRVLSDLWQKYVTDYGPRALEMWDKEEF